MTVRSTKHPANTFLASPRTEEQRLEEGLVLLLWARAMSWQAILRILCETPPGAPWYSMWRSEAELGTAVFLKIFSPGEIAGASHAVN